MDEFVTVSVRIRPNFKKEASNPCLQIINKHPAVLLVSDKSQMYHFDNIFADDVQQVDIYNNTVKRLVDKVKLGYNCTVFAYGQTGTGKTYTIGTNPNIRDENEFGLISRTLEDFFSHENVCNDIDVAISFIEIYNEKVFDLLGSDTSKALSVKGFTVQGFNKLSVSSSFEAVQYLKHGSSKRHIGGTKQNSNSSRSHAIFTIHCYTQNGEEERVAKLNLVDLAGSESVRKTGNQGSSFYEGININKGLLSLGQVMTALSTNSSHVPYRQSVITTILQDSLNKKNFVSLIACVSANPEDLGETLQTLEFSNRVKKLKNKPEVNEFMTQYKKDNSGLFANNSTKAQTPMKRTNAYSYETPFKKPKNALPMIRETVFSMIPSNLDITPLHSSSMSIGSKSQQNFSPVVRKYISALESSIMNKLEDVIKNTLKRPKKTRGKENLSTSRISWDGFSADDEKNDSFATSSPDRNGNMGGKEITENLKPKKLLLTDDSSFEDSQTNLDQFVFKVPETKIQTVQTENRIRRSSVRLQLKTNPSSTKTQPSVTRRSVRLQRKDEPVIKTSESVRRQSMRLREKAVTSDSPKETFTKKTQNKRLTATPCINCVKKTTRKSIDSPMTTRTNKVLNILNTGKLREIEKLHTVGPKTAEKILLFREVKGYFKSVSDIKEMPYWTKKKYDKFLAENFLRD